MKLWVKFRPLVGVIEELKAVSGGKRLVLVMDKGFYSENNKEGHRFLISVPFTPSYTKELIEGERGSIDKTANIVKTSSHPIRGVSRKIPFDRTELTAHVLYNPERNSLYSHTLWLKEQVQGGRSPPVLKRILRNT